MEIATFRSGLIIAFSGINQYSITHGGGAEISCLPVGIEDIDPQGINIYPNPAIDHLTIDIAKNKGNNYNLEIINSTGEQVFNQKINGHQSLNILDFPKGIYFIKAWSGNSQIFYEKFIKSE